MSSDMLLFSLLLSTFFLCTLANVEKTVFLGPPAITIPVAHPNLDDLYLIPLSPLHLSARTLLNASFPTSDAPRGAEHWVLLDGLSPGSRYEVRLCWLATQPTAFSLQTFALQEVFDDPDLIGSLSAYAYARQAEIDDLERQKLAARRTIPLPASASLSETRASVLFLRILAAADYYTLDQNLMENVPPVPVDIILDPYLFNILPKSLLPPAGYILVVAVASWFVSAYVWRLMSGLVTPSAEDDDEDVQRHGASKLKAS